MQDVLILNLGSMTGPHLACADGIHQYLQQNDLHWDVRIQPTQKGNIPSGAVVIHDRPMHVSASWLRNARHPLGTVFGPRSQHTRPCVRFDQERFGTLAAHHLRDRGYRRACIIETPALRSSTEECKRIDGFRTTCAKLGMEVYTYHLDNPDSEPELLSWLSSTTQAQGIYASSDDRAVWLRDLLLQSKVRFPARLALIGTGNHLQACMAKQPQLTSVSYPWKLMGEAIGHWAHRAFQGETDPEPMLLRPYRVIDRASTPSVAYKDPLVAESMHWLKKNLRVSRPLHNLAQAMACTPTTLCRHFKKAIGQGPQKIHDAMRMERAIQLLEQDELSITAISKQTGFTSPTAFGIAFKRRYACSPTQWRKSI